MASSKTNEQISAEEVAAFIAEKPERYFAYRGWGPHHVPGARIVTTWTGQELGRVIRLGEVYTSNFGDKRQSFRIRAINGETYSGTAYIDAGDYVRMCKVQA